MKINYPRLALGFFWSLILTWVLGTLYMEAQLGWPSDRASWGHRAIGWFVSSLLLWTFVRGLRRVQALKAG